VSKELIQGIAAPFDRDNIDTDQIIPTEYLKSIKKFGFGDYLFDGWRYLDKGYLGMTSDQREINTDFILNQAPYQGAKILLTRDNFGCGSSREHAVWALRDFGFEAVVASSFGDIFFNNCFKNQILPVQLSKENISKLFDLVNKSSQSFDISLVSKELRVGLDLSISFEVEDNLLDRIIYNLDDVDITMKDKASIEIFESNHRNQRPWIFK